jgi:hypothetical protein
VRNIADTTVISIHVYGTDLSRVGSSAGGTFRELAKSPYCLAQHASHTQPP